ncbi:16S rRNA (cytosine967-C5)-methyltransferase [Granulicella pectinivorans]|uniref:16S rRNA (Cytosine967-C5)-methyltransferase n=1 Tax=Granulicella pectinivorans TaxID=474950 RepID=A0A1I6MPJ3_9BACT|nr:transcription antitermination factor NusB [Granulicella pectinivorans]SFS17498.1 16S rRNA (cytosine967-C5)-methyltransferase [Granulicella pectinivorans]
MKPGKQGSGTREQGAGKKPRQFVKGRPASAGPTRSAAEAQAKVSPARRVAFEILLLVGANKGHSDELLHGVRTEELSEADRNLATALVMGVLRWEIALDARVRVHLQRPDQALPEPVALALRMGAFQLQHMDRIPAHAALSESVELCRAAGHPHATGMVNAILRKVAAAQKPKERIFESVAAFAERLGHPRWMVERWVANYGRDKALKICEADQTEPVAGGVFEALDNGDQGAGKMPQMDDGSRLVAEIAAAAAPAVEGRALRVWDCCAAPGGKTLMLALRTKGEVLASDVSARRLEQMKGRLRRHSYAEGVRTLAVDAAALPASEGEFDLILCDVPCSGTGTLARNPEIRFRMTQEELGRQAGRQREILGAALKRLAPGGRLVYSTCSLEPEENEAVVGTVGDGFRRIPVGEFLGGIPGLKEGGDLSSAVVDGALRTLPGVDGCDGFFAVVVERV